MTEIDDQTTEPAADHADGTGETRPVTGEPVVDQALGTLDDLTDRPLSEHPDRFADVLQQLNQVLNPDDSSGTDGDDPAGS